MVTGFLLLVVGGIFFFRGELFGWMSPHKPDEYDVLPPDTDTAPGEMIHRYEDKLSRNGGTDQEGAFSNYWDYPGFSITKEAEELAEEILDSDSDVLEDDDFDQEGGEDL